MRASKAHVVERASSKRGCELRQIWTARKLLRRHQQDDLLGQVERDLPCSALLTGLNYALQGKHGIALHLRQLLGEGQRRNIL